MSDEDQSKSKERILRRVTRSESATVSSSSNSTSSVSSAARPKAPDGGYGYVIVFSAFMTMVITDGVACAFGVLYADLLNVFQESKSLTSWILSIYNCASCLFGPLSSALAIKYGCRKMQIFGGIIASVGIFASAFSNSVGMMCVTYGVVGGFGMSVGYVTSVVMVAKYFEKKRALAMGISVCGSGIGTFIFAPLFEHLLRAYNWHGTLIITSAITLNLVVFGALLRPLEHTSKEKLQKNLETFEKTYGNKSDGHVPTHRVLDEKSNFNDVLYEQMNHSAPQLPTLREDEEEILKVPLSKIVTNTSNVKCAFHRKIRKMNAKENTIADFEQGIKFSGMKSKSQDIERVNDCQNQLYDHLNKTSISYGRILSKLAVNDLQFRSCPILNRDIPTDNYSDEEGNLFCFEVLVMKAYKHTKRFLNLMFDPSILRLPFFIMFLISNFILYFWYDLPYVFFFDYTIELGLSNERAAYLISIIGIVSTVGQVMYGIIADRNIHLAILYTVSLIICGFSVLAIPLVKDYTMLCLIAGSIGLFISANYCLTPVILVEIVGVDKLTNAYGLIMMVQGVANLFGPPVAGKLYDVSGSYYNTFFIGGLLISFSGVLVVVVEILRYFKDRCKKLCIANARTAEQEKEEDVDTTVRLINVLDIEIKV
ncbi:hypothetical protein FSP39_024822 [Pinctada imbricata]|uniref:Major facilitator superfamily (MFS) profile domain-containing protein n=1 Tax=Pinctada imbricata TaxID=66713 RepID=A0AA88Y7Y3_PINIB|nr:hypothetical protein FSP39_024822 [Pinctada imbricata]